jgi:RNA polymerase sigma factor (sigma-70 family)
MGAGVSGLGGGRVFRGDEMRSASELVAEYARERSEGAFRELVARYVDLVYSTARRLVGEAPLAEDVTQTVFLDLARGAGGLSGDVMLGGWLHRHTCFVAARTMRGERRRQRRERRAVEMSPPEGAAGDRELLPILDRAIDSLASEDRTAILLRFFEQRDFRAIGAALGSSEDAARKRVARGLDKLAAILKRQGFVFGAASLATALGGKAVSAAPAGLAAAIASKALLAGSGSATLTTVKVMALTKLKLGVATAVLMIAMVAPLVVSRQSAARLRDENRALRLQVDRLAQLETENDRLSRMINEASAHDRAQASELDKLRRSGRKPTPVARPPEPPPAISPKTGRPYPATAGQFRPVAAWSNAGFATPAASFETWTWAHARRDAKLIASMLTFDPAARAQAESLFASLPDGVRARLGSVEGMIAAAELLAVPRPEVRVLEQEARGENRIILRTEWRNADGRTGPFNMLFDRAPDGRWHAVINTKWVTNLPLDAAPFR